MDLSTQPVDMEAQAPVVLLNREDAQDLGVNPLDRIEIHQDGETTIGIVDVTDAIVPQGTLGLSKRLQNISGTVHVSIATKPDSVRAIRKKLHDEELDEEEIYTLIEDVDKDRLNDVELGAYVSGIYSNGLSLNETITLTQAMTDIGDVLTWDVDVVADKHSIGGVAGNRVTPIIIPIIAAAGITIPKTSSRAITSPSGTADTLEVLCDVEFSIDDIQAIVEETNGCMVWGGGVNLSPVDDKIIRAEHPLSLDPEGQVLASVLSKKKSAGSTHILIDIPYGEGSKVDNLPAARDLAKQFKRIGSHMDMEIACTITRGSQPIGDGIGPILEARDILKVLQGDGPEDLLLKSVRLADILLDLCGSDESARDILDDGRALDKFREIIKAQNGDPDVEVDDLQPGDEQEVVFAKRAGTVTHINNKAISEIARRAGAPKDAGAGIRLHKHVGATVEKGDELFTIYAEKRDKLVDAKSAKEKGEPVRVRSREESLVEQV